MNLVVVELNNELNFSQKIRKLQTKLDMWSSRDLTIFGMAMVLKILGLSQLVYSSSNLAVPQGTVNLVRMKLQWSRRLTVQFCLKDPLKRFSCDSSVGRKRLELG